jgi:ankyrin repeat protein
LAWAAQRGKSGVVEILLATGHVDANSYDGFRKTPLMKGAAHGHSKVVQLLLHKAKLNGQDMFGHTALPLSTRNG